MLQMYYARTSTTYVHVHAAIWVLSAFPSSPQSSIARNFVTEQKTNNQRVAVQCALSACIPSQYCVCNSGVYYVRQQRHVERGKCNEANQMSRMRFVLLILLWWVLLAGCWCDKQQMWGWSRISLIDHVLGALNGGNFVIQLIAHRTGMNVNGNVWLDWWWRVRFFFFVGLKLTFRAIFWSIFVC